MQRASETSGIGEPAKDAHEAQDTPDRRERSPWRALLPTSRRDLLLALAFGVGIAAVWLHAAGPGAGAGYDFFGAYYTAGRDVAAGISPYHQLAKLTTDAQSGGVHGTGYVYPPLLALLLSLPIRLGFDARGVWLLWTLLTVAVVLWMGYELNRHLRDSRSWSGALAFALASLLPAIVIYDLSLGQADVLLAALAVCACGLWLRGNRWSAGITLGAAIAIKPTLALLLLVWLWKGDWRTTWRGAAAALALVAGPFALLGPGALQQYVAFFVRWNAFSANADIINQTPYAFLLRAFTANTATPPLIVAPWLVWPLRLALLIGAALLWLRAVPRRRESHLLEMSSCLLALPLILLLSPLAEDIHFTLLAPALAGLSWVAWRVLTPGSPSKEDGRADVATRLAGWALWAALLVSYLPRMQELIYPNHLFAFPGQNDPHIGPLVTLLRSGALLWLAVVTLAAGQAVVRAARCPHPQPLPRAREREAEETSPSAAIHEL
jgi:hypothetical protein